MSRPDSGSAGAELEEAAASGSGAVAVELEGDCTAGGGLLGEVGLEARGAAVAKVAVWGGARQEGVEKDGPRAHVRCCWSCCQLQVCVSWLLQVPRCCRNASAVLLAKKDLLLELASQLASRSHGAGRATASAPDVRDENREHAVTSASGPATRPCANTAARANMFAFWPFQTSMLLSFLLFSYLQRGSFSGKLFGPGSARPSASFSLTVI